MKNNSISKKVHSKCLLCGKQNPWSQNIKFYKDNDECICGKFQANSKLQGYDGILHGGVITALLDATMTHCLFHHGIQAVTGDIHVRFLHPVPCNANIDLQACILLAKSPLYSVKAKLICNTKTMAKAEAKFMQYVQSNV